MAFSMDERFWARASIAEPDECWLWTAAVSKDGYGQLYDAGQLLYAHRVALELNGADLTGLQVDHLCRVRACVNPAHLEAVTQTENLRRQGEAQTHCKHGHAFSENVGRDGRGHRFCVLCRNASARRSYYRKKAAA